MDIMTYRLQQHTRHKSPAMIGVYVREAEIKAVPTYPESNREARKGRVR